VPAKVYSYGIQIQPTASYNVAASTTPMDYQQELSIAATVPLVSTGS
jgi:hypothetical protein